MNVQRGCGSYFISTYGGRDGAGREAELQLKAVKTTEVLF